jgi:hypothetical protein
MSAPLDAPLLDRHYQLADYGDEEMVSRNVVNLDALLPRQDLSSPAEASADLEGLKLADLEPGLIYAFLRKPDFQRETTNWSPEQVADLIETFATGNIIPSIILWQSGQRVFVIDGAHRLSALIAWVRDDYGAGKVSTDKYENVIPETQKLMHDATRELVQKKIGSYEEHLAAAKYPNTAKDALLKRASQFPFRRIDAQWIRNATPEQARDAFFRINQGGTKIDPTEIRILRAKNSAIAISARAVSRGGTGHNYWEKFDKGTQEEIERLSAELNKMLFAPPLHQPVKTLDVSVAGFGYGSHVLPFAFDLVTRTNNLGLADSTRRSSRRDEIPDDPDGKQTLEYLNSARKAVKLICSNDPSSLGLHPALYFYTPEGIFQSAALFNAADWFMELATKNRLNEFLKVRRYFEDLILEHPILVRPPAHTLGSGSRTRARSVSLYARILSLLLKGTTTKEVWNTIIAEPDFLYLKPEDRDQKNAAFYGVSGKPFSAKAKSAGYFAQALPIAPRCPLCGGLLHTNGMTADHKEEKAQGGSSASSNARYVHPICNSNRQAMGL